MNNLNLPTSTESTVSAQRPICPTCSNKVEGRSDKIFCCIPCKNKHHSDARLQFKTRFGNSINRIKRNYLLLEGIMGKSHNRLKIHKDSLFQHGFDISHHLKSCLKGKQLIYEIGEYQFREFENGIIEVKRMAKLSIWMPGFFERWLFDFPNIEVVDGQKGEKGKELKRGSVGFREMERFDE